VQGRMLEVQQASVDMAGASRLEQIRASLHGGPVTPQVTAGDQATQPAPAPQLNKQQQPGTA
jgi:phage shock protein A